MPATNKRQKTTHATHLPKGVFTQILSYCEDPMIMYKQQHKEQWKYISVTREEGMSVSRVQAVNRRKLHLLYGTPMDVTSIISIQHPEKIENWDEELEEYCFKNYFKCVSCDMDTISATPREDRHGFGEAYHCQVCCPPYN
jgi:hypothetical protein